MYTRCHEYSSFPVEIHGVDKCTKQRHGRIKHMLRQKQDFSHFLPGTRKRHRRRIPVNNEGYYRSVPRFSEGGSFPLPKQADFDR